MDKLEIHTLICKKDIDLFLDTIKLFKYHSGLNFKIVIHEDGSFSEKENKYIFNRFDDVDIINREFADNEIKNFISDYEFCSHFRLAEHHTIFRIKLFDPFYFTKSNNILYLDSDILFCKSPDYLINLILNKTGGYLRDSWSSYCVPFRDEDSDKFLIDRFINAGLNYYPTIEHYSLHEINNCIKILYDHGSRGATHPFLEQTCIAYMITQLRKNGVTFNELPYPDYCVPTFGEFVKDHGRVALHLNSSPLVGNWREHHYNYELSKL